MTELRNFLFLQGPIGPFFKELATELRSNGHVVQKVNFCGGDDAFFPDAIHFTGHPREWPSAALKMCFAKNISDIVLFGDCRGYHEDAIEILSEACPSIRVWVFEEGYFRPHWITLDQFGVNARSSLPKGPIELQAAIQAAKDVRAPETQAVDPWIREFTPTAIRYHIASFLGAGKYEHFEYHRVLHPVAEAASWAFSFCKRLAGIDDKAEVDRFEKRSVKAHFVLALQLEGDFQLRRYSPFASNEELIHHTLTSYAKSGQKNPLILKVHPYDHGWHHWKNIAMAKAGKLGIEDRVIVLYKGGTTNVLSDCKGFITVNSTFAMTAMEQGVPVKALGNAFWNFTPLTNSVDLDQFWHTPVKPKMSLFAEYRQFVMSETQYNGGFYSKQSRALCLKAVATTLGTKEQNSQKLSRLPTERLREKRKRRLQQVESIRSALKKLDILA